MPPGKWRRAGGARSALVHVGASAAKRIHQRGSAESDGYRFASRIAMTIDTASRSRGALRPRFAVRFALFETEGAGKTGCLLHPRSRVRFAQTKLHTSIQGSGNTPAFPAQWLYGLLRALPGERLFCHRRCAGNQPHTTCRQHRGVRTTRLRRTRQARTSIAPSASIASHRTFVTIASAPHLP